MGQLLVCMRTRTTAAARPMPLRPQCKAFRAFAPHILEFLATYCQLLVVWDSIELPRTGAQRGGAWHVAARALLPCAGTACTARVPYTVCMPYTVCPTLCVPYTVCVPWLCTCRGGGAQSVQRHLRQYADHHGRPHRPSDTLHRAVDRAAGALAECSHSAAISGGRGVQPSVVSGPVGSCGPCPHRPVLCSRCTAPAVREPLQRAAPNAHCAQRGPVPGHGLHAAHGAHTARAAAHAHACTLPPAAH